VLALGLELELVLAYRFPYPLVFVVCCSIRIAVNCELSREEVDKVVAVLDSVTKSL